ncbi:MAG TPA: 6-bladed beta-propeller [Armatimonadota bacterium]|jgi:DNA-binding beta-propeller fold protein YncE
MKELIFALLILSSLLQSSPARTQTNYSGLLDFSYCFSINGYGSEAVFGKPNSVFLDERTHYLYIADTKAGEVNVFTTLGVPVSQFGAGNGLKAPYGVAVDSKKNLYVSEDDGGPLKIIDAKGETSPLEIPSDDPKIAARPGRITVDSEDNLYVVDRASNRIAILDKDRKLKFRVGSYGRKRGQFRELQDVAVDRQGRIYALDSSGTFPVQVFDKKGKYLFRMGFQGDGTEDISLASGICIDRNDQVWIVDRGQHALKVFDRSGIFLRKFGSYGTGNGSLFYPIDAKTDNAGRIYVLEIGGERLQVFSLVHPNEPFVPAGL